MTIELSKEDRAQAIESIQRYFQQERLQARVSELDFEVHADEFVYWRKFDKARRGAARQDLTVSSPLTRSAGAAPHQGGAWLRCAHHDRHPPGP